MKGPPLDPKGPCPYLPGSEGRVLTYQRRMDEGWAMQHPGDVTIEDMHTVYRPFMDSPGYKQIELKMYQSPRNRKGMGR